MSHGRSVLTAMGVALADLLLLSPARSLGAPGGYMVSEGDTLSEIAATFGVSVELLAEVNGIEDPDHILAGQVLRVPGPDESVLGADSCIDQTPGSDTYAVRLGDTLSEIAERFRVPASAIAEASGLTDPHFVVEGLERGLVRALAYIESGWQQHVVSDTGAVGAMQIQPSTGCWLETEVFGYDLDIESSAYDNIKAGVRYLRILRDLTGDMDQAAAAYYQGYGALSVGILYEDTVQYVANINAIRDWYWP